MEALPKKYTMEHTVCNPDVPHASTRAALKTPTADCDASSASWCILTSSRVYVLKLFINDKDLVYTSEEVRKCIHYRNTICRM